MISPRMEDVTQSNTRGIDGTRAACREPSRTTVPMGLHYRATRVCQADGKALSFVTCLACGSKGPWIRAAKGPLARNRRIRHIPRRE